MAHQIKPMLLSEVKRTFEYRVVVQAVVESNEEFEKRVTDLLNDNWMVSGGVGAVTATGYDRLTQAIVRVRIEEIPPGMDDFFKEMRTKGPPVPGENKEEGGGGMN